MRFGPYLHIHEQMGEFVKRLYASGLAQPGQLRGCTPEEIQTLQTKYDLVLPESYRLFLESMGHGAGKFGSAYESLLYPTVLERTRQEREQEYPTYQTANVRWFERLMIRLFEVADRLHVQSKRRSHDDPFKLPPDLLVIYSGSWGVSEHWVIRCNGGDDSPVYHYDDEGEGLRLEKQFDSLFAFLEMLREEAERNDSASRH